MTILTDRQTDRQTDRIAFLDFIKGIAAMMVVLSHLPVKVPIYNSFISFLMLPLFFFASGYLTKVPKKHILRDFLYKRVGKLFVLYAIYLVVLPFTSILEIKQIIGNPILIIEKLANSLTNIFLGKEFWFVSCLIVINIIFLFVVLISRRNNLAILLISTFLCIIGVLVSDREIIPWNVDTALVCQLIFVMGYLAKEYDLVNKINRKGLLCAIVSICYLSVFVVDYFMFDKAGINVALNDWGIWFVTIPAIILGIMASVLIGELTGGVKFINYVGAHSLLYFAFASHGGSIFVKLFAKLSEITSISMFSNAYIINPLACVSGCLIMVIPCLFIDKFLPFLNGNFKMPLPKKQN